MRREHRQAGPHFSSLPRYSGGGLGWGSSITAVSLSPVTPSLTLPRSTEGGNERRLPILERSKTSRGFTLLEVLAALLLVGIVLPIIFSALTLVMNVSNDARKRVQATSLAESKLKELTAGQILQTDSTGTTSGDFSPDHPEFRWEATSVDSSDSNAAVTEVDVTVKWDSRGGERSIDLSTFVYDSSNTTTSTGSAATPIGGGQ